MAAIKAPRTLRAFDRADLVKEVFDAKTGRKLWEHHIDVYLTAVGPGELLTRRAPPWLRTMPITAASPSPRPVNFVVKKGSKILARVVSSIPDPLSRTSRQL